MRPIILERGDIRLLQDFLRKATKWCHCGKCKLCKKRKIVKGRLGEMIPSGEEIPYRLIFEEGDVQCLVDLIDEAAKRHFCQTPYLEAFCEICRARGLFERRLLALSY